MCAAHSVGGRRARRDAVDDAPPRDDAPGLRARAFGACTLVRKFGLGGTEHSAVWRSGLKGRDCAPGVEARERGGLPPAVRTRKSRGRQAVETPRRR